MYQDLHFQAISSHAAPGAVILFLSENGYVPLPKAETSGVILSYPVNSGISACLIRIKEPTRVAYELSEYRIYLVSCSYRSSQRVSVESSSPGIRNLLLMWR